MHVSIYLCLICFDDAIEVGMMPDLIDGLFTAWARDTLRDKSFWDPPMYFPIGKVSIL
jgi:hypothetical protein